MTDPENIYHFEEGEILLISKPVQWTSFDVVNHLRYFLRNLLNVPKIKVGHAGTLDPQATGLLIICTGKATKQIYKFTELDKEYTGTMQLGATTPSFDTETEIDQMFDYSHITTESLIETTKQFTGKIQQTPPLYSAVKVNGKPAYIYARKNKNVEIKSREVTIHLFELSNINIPDIEFRVVCSKGTYLRSLVNDFGKVLSCGAYLKTLCRTRIGNYTLAEAFTIDEFKQECLKNS